MATAPKTATSTIKRGAGQLRPTSGESGMSSSASIIVGNNPQESMHSEPLKIIAEVDGIITKKIISYMLSFF